VSSVLSLISTLIPSTPPHASELRCNGSLGFIPRSEASLVYPPTHRRPSHGEPQYHHDVATVAESTLDPKSLTASPPSGSTMTSASTRAPPPHPPPSTFAQRRRHMAPHSSRSKWRRPAPSPAACELPPLHPPTDPVTLLQASATVVDLAGRLAGLGCRRLDHYGLGCGCLSDYGLGGVVCVRNENSREMCGGNENCRVWYWTCSGT
jgi:hypothetical protein